jgi:hypothetical protein
MKLLKIEPDFTKDSNLEFFYVTKNLEFIVT